MIYSEFYMNKIINKQNNNKTYYDDKFTESIVVMNTRQDWLFSFYKTISFLNAQKLKPSSTTIVE